MADDELNQASDPTSPDAPPDAPPDDPTIEDALPQSSVRLLAHARALPEVDGGVQVKPHDAECIVAFKDVDGRTMHVVFDPRSGMLAKTNAGG